MPLAQRLTPYDREQEDLASEQRTRALRRRTRPREVPPPLLWNSLPPRDCLRSRLRVVPPLCSRRALPPRSFRAARQLGPPRSDLVLVRGTPVT